MGGLQTFPRNSRPRILSAARAGVEANMSSTTSPEEIKRIIREAFSTTRKGKGIGLREATALDNYASEEEQISERSRDVEEHWWDIVEEGEGQLGTALSFTDREGLRFLLPATMCSSLDGAWLNTHPVLFTLCFLHPSALPPHHGYPEYTDYLRSIHPSEWIEFLQLTIQQVRAIALFLKWADDDLGGERQIESILSSHESSLKYAGPGHYTLSIEDAVNNYDQERRILHEWFLLGGISQN
jgi:hypothetical protein